MGAYHKNSITTKASVYGSFLLDDSEYALSVSSIQEVINEPSEYTAVPFTPDYVLGLLNLRDIIVTVIDLRCVFSTQEHSSKKCENTECNDAGRKIAIVEHNGRHVGLLFDDTSEVFNSNDVETCWFESQEESETGQVVLGVFKIEGKRRMVKILDGLQIMNLAKVPLTNNPESSNNLNLSQSVRKQCVTFEIGTMQCALDISSINEIVNLDMVRNKVLAHGVCIGTIDIRGDTVPVINGSPLLGLEDKCTEGYTQNENSRVIVMKAGDQPFGLLVSSLNSIVSYHQHDIAVFPDLDDSKVSMFAGCISSSDGSAQTILLNYENILNTDEIVAVVNRNSVIYKNNSEKSRKLKESVTSRNSMITFKLNSHYGLDMQDVREVINYPDDSIKSLNLPDSLAGMINLRDELIAVIDTRKLYSMGKPDVSTAQKVLIFENKGIKWGLLVDSVDSIVSFGEDNLVDMPDFMFNSEDSLIRKDIKKTVIINSDSDPEPVGMLDLACVASRACDKQAICTQQ